MVDKSRLPIAVQWPPRWLPPIAVALILLAWPFVAYAAHQAWLMNKNRIEDWLPANFPETKSLNAFYDRFGSDEFLMISWPGCTLDDPRATELERALLEPAPDGITYFDKADSSRHIIDSVLSTSRVSHAEALKRFTRLFIGEDRQQACVIALVSQSGLENRKLALDCAWRASQKATGLTLDAIHIAGSTADSVAVDVASNAYLLELNLVSAFVCFLILIVSLRNLWLVGTVFLTAFFNEQLALALIYYSGGRIDSVQLLVANLAFVLSISAGLHYLGYFRDAVCEGVASPAWEAVRKSIVPSVLAAVTTSLGFLSLCTSEIVPIRRFGFYASVVVPINASIIVSLLAVHATWTTRRNWRGQLIPMHSSSSLPGNPIQEQHPSVGWTKALVSLLKKSPLGIAVCWLVVVTILGFGVSRLQTSVGTHKLLSAKDKLILDYAWLEQRIGPLIPVEMVLHFSKADPSKLPSAFERLRMLEQLRAEISGVPEIKCAMSVLDFIPTLPHDGGMRNTIIRSVITAAANNARDNFRQMRLMYEDETEQCWRISGRVNGSSTIDYQRLLDNVHGAVESFQASHGNPAVSVDVSGGVPFVYRTQRQLLQDMLSSFSSAFAMIALTMGLLFRSVWAGLMSMLPNVTPAAVVFGIMGWSGLEVELGTVLTASVMMGVCVDDTLHLISHFRMLRAKGMSPYESVDEALANCGGAMLQTAVVCGVGMLVFAFSPFTPVSRFAWLTFALLMVGVVSDLVLTPAIMLSPMHRVFFRDRQQSEANLP